MANRRTVQPEQEKMITDLHSQGKSARSIAEALAVPVSTMYATCERLGLKLRRGSNGTRRSGITDEQIQEMAVEYLNGKSAPAIAAYFGVDCGIVYRYLRDAGLEIRPRGFGKGEDHHAWVGGRIVATSGYVLVKIDSSSPFYPMAQKKAESAEYVFEHRLVVAQRLGRCLTDKETVHHIDGNKQNNLDSNLQLRNGKHGKGSVLQCAHCGSQDIKSVPLATVN